MSSTILLGPLLGYEKGEFYTVCLLTVPSVTTAPQLELSTGAKIAFTSAATTPSGTFWRSECTIQKIQNAQEISYSITIDGAALSTNADEASWTFRVPAVDEAARVAYACCNGFSSQALAASTAEPYVMWEKLRAEHASSPFALLLMGGDQLYADTVLNLPVVKEWTEKTADEMVAYVPTAQLISDLDKFYDKLYQERWANKAMAHIFATVPSVMMWDDHDIVDGWGSHDDVPQNTKMYCEIYKAARKYFKIYQLRTVENHSLLAPAQAGDDDGHFALGFDFCDYRVLAMDHRSNRTLNTVMTDPQHEVVKAWIASIPQDVNPRPVLALSGIPVVYRSFAALESTMEFTPWTEEATDDVRDHWMAAHHRGERIRLMKNLMNCKAPVWLLSGDVHVGALGVLRDSATDKEIFQVISTGIVHPPPTAIQWAGLRFLTNDDPEKVAGTTISTEMLTPNNGPRYIRDRNFATFRRDAKGKVWVNWICESQGKTNPPEFVA